MRSQITGHLYFSCTFLDRIFLDPFYKTQTVNDRICVRLFVEERLGPDVKQNTFNFDLILTNILIAREVVTKLDLQAASNSSLQLVCRSPNINNCVRIVSNKKNAKSMAMLLREFFSGKKVDNWMRLCFLLNSAKDESKATENMNFF